MPILNDIPFELDTKALLSRLHVDASDDMAEEILAVVEEVAPVIAPKAIYEVCYIESKEPEGVILSNGTEFTSRVLRTNLDEAERVFAYIATCGSEVDALGLAKDDFVVGFWLDSMKEMALAASSRYLRQYLRDQHQLGKFSSMNPGAGDPDTWPIEQQRELFGIFGDTEDLIGVRLTDSYLMIPNKTVSGVFFPTEVPFESCQVCQREDCPGRRADYDPDFLDTHVSHGCIEPEEDIDDGGPH